MTGITRTCRCDNGTYRIGENTGTTGHVCPAKTQMSLRIHTDREETSLPVGRIMGTFATHRVPSEDSDQTARDAQSDLSLRCVHILVLSTLLKSLFKHANTTV